MASLEAFLDTNVLVYVVDSDPAKARIAANLIAQKPVVSVQVLNEFALVARRKMARPWPEVREMLRWLREHCSVVAETLEVHERGLGYAERNQLAVYDAMIVAAAVLAGCTTLWSEDMHDGLVIDGLTVRNPFRH